MRDAIIIGGGISGLTAAWHLSQAGYKVIILEKEDIIGGLARSFFLDGEWIPITYHHVMLPDKNTLDYVTRLNRHKDLRWIKSVQSIWYDRKRYNVDPLGIMLFKPLDIVCKLRIIYLGIYSWLKKDWNDLNDTGCDEWLGRVAGQKNLEILFKPLIAMKFNMPLSSVSAAWLGKRMHQAVRNNDMYGYLNGGWQGLFEKMTDDIRRRGGEIKLGFEVRGVSDGNVSGIDASGKSVSLSSETIISTMPPTALRGILNIPAEKKAPLECLRYKSMISFVCGTDKDISSRYWSVVLKPNLIFGGFFNQSLLSGFKDRSGNFIYYFFTYIESDNRLFTMDEGALAKRYLEDIRTLFPDFSFKWNKIFRLKEAQPVFARNYQNLPIELTDKIFLTGVYRRYPNPRTMDSAFCAGREVADHIINKHGRS